MTAIQLLLETVFSRPAFACLQDDLKRVKVTFAGSTQCTQWMIPTLAFNTVNMGNLEKMQHIADAILCLCMEQHQSDQQRSQLFRDVFGQRTVDTWSCSHLAAYMCWMDCLVFLVEHLGAEILIKKTGIGKGVSARGLAGTIYTFRHITRLLSNDHENHDISPSDIYRSHVRSYVKTIDSLRVVPSTSGVLDTRKTDSSNFRP